jgi:hypothetical protein
MAKALNRKVTYQSKTGKGTKFIVLFTLAK